MQFRVSPTIAWFDFCSSSRTHIAPPSTVNGLIHSSLQLCHLVWINFSKRYLTYFSFITHVEKFHLFSYPTTDNFSRPSHSCTKLSPICTSEAFFDFPRFLFSLFFFYFPTYNNIFYFNITSPFSTYSVRTSQTTPLLFSSIDDLLHQLHWFYNQIFFIFYNQNFTWVFNDDSS